MLFVLQITDTSVINVNCGFKIGIGFTTMASIFTYDPDPPRVSSPWSTSGSSTPQVNASGSRGLAIRTKATPTSTRDNEGPNFLSDYGIIKLEPEPQEGPTEYKLHLLLRPRRPYVSMSTGHVVAGSYHSRGGVASSSVSASPSQDATPRPMQAKSAQSRQQRLQGLTTQLLWRLQQSSPFHSSTTANLVVPVLPDMEETLQLGVPSKPARLLPGLEESQGALYEIGVSDDGTFVGLTRDELDESMATLQTMAASLGCKVEVLRRVIVGECEWADDFATSAPGKDGATSESLWVAEALVSPDLEFYNMSPSKPRHTGDDSQGPEDTAAFVAGEDYSQTEQIRISIAGPSTAGKSSLLGALTSSQLDNGRGKSRLGLLKHRHEISSGITSSVAQELIGYTGEEPLTVVNYASGNVAAWDDIHATSNEGRLAFVSDLPGSIRYMKSSLRGLVSWAPHYVILCIPANCGEETAEADANNEHAAEIDLCLAYLNLCLKLEIPVLVVVTKLDIASRTELRENLGKVLSALKTANRKPAMLPASPAGDKIPDLQHVSATDCKSVKDLIQTTNGNWNHVVPIILSSAVDGSGIGKLHAFLRYLPIPSIPRQRALHLGKSISGETPTNVFDVDEVFAIPPSKVYSMSKEKSTQENRGMVLCGVVRHGNITIGDEMTIGPILVDTSSENDNAPINMLSRSSGPGPSNDFPSSFSLNALPGRDGSPTQGKWQRVRVVSVRNLRLSVRFLMKDQVGTIGIEFLESPDPQRPRLSRIRKGMVLTNPPPSGPPIQTPKTTKSSMSPLLSLPFHTGFIATFPAAEFSAPNSPPLLLGGNAIAYIANIRTTVRVVCMALAKGDEPSEPASPSEPEFFSFEGENSPPGRAEKSSAQVRRRPSATDISKVVSGSTNTQKKGAFEEHVQITFALVSSVEWIELGSQVLVMPGVSMGTSSAASGPGSSAGAPSGMVTMSGLEGFVGNVSEVIPGRNSVSNE